MNVEQREWLKKTIAEAHKLGISGSDLYAASMAVDIAISTEEWNKEEPDAQTTFQDVAEEYWCSMWNTSRDLVSDIFESLNAYLES